MAGTMEGGDVGVATLLEGWFGWERGEGNVEPYTVKIAIK
jgi:hypothetical protein